MAEVDSGILRDGQAGLRVRYPAIENIPPPVYVVGMGIPSPVFGGIAMQGEDCAVHLASRVMAVKLSELGIPGTERDIVEVSSSLARDPSGTSLEFAKFAKWGAYPECESIGSQPVPSGFVLSVETRKGWKVEMQFGDSNDSARISVLSKTPSPQSSPEWRMQDLPSGSPSETFVESAPNPYASGTPFAFVARERHYFQGELWDPNPESAADRGYYEDGTQRWRMHYCSGRAKARGGRPWCEFFWQNGERHIVEFGDDEQGRHRPPGEGPAYSEFYPDGKPALEIFAVAGVRSGPARWYNEDGLPGAELENADQSLPCRRLLSGVDPLLLQDSFSMRHRKDWLGEIKPVPPSAPLTIPSPTPAPPKPSPQSRGKQSCGKVR